MKTKGAGQTREAVVASNLRLVYHIAFSAAFGRHRTGWQITTLFDFDLWRGRRIQNEKHYWTDRIRYKPCWWLLWQNRIYLRSLTRYLIGFDLTSLDDGGLSYAAPARRAWQPYTLPWGNMKSQPLSIYRKELQSMKTLASDFCTG